MNCSVTPNFNNAKINFKAIPVAEYSYLGEDTKISMYKLEKRDIPYLQNLVNNMDAFYKKYDVDNESARQVTQEAFSAGIEVLKGEKHPEEKADILMAFYNNEPCSILIGNVLKTDKNGKLHYSSRKNHAKGETELDWLATWNKKFKRKGQTTVCEYFHRLLDSGFKQCYVRSELPEKSDAVKFYTLMGFERLSDEDRKILRKNDNSYLIGKYDDEDDKIIPMKATAKSIKETMGSKADELQRREIKNGVSCELPEEIF